MGFIKSFNKFNNFKFELVENRATYDSILENKDQSLSILRKKGVSESDPTYVSLRYEIEKLYKNINYLGLMTKYIFEQEVSFQEIKDLLIWLKFNGGKLPKNPLEYKNFEDIKDDTIKVDNNQRVKVIYSLLPSEQKKLAKNNPPFYEKALEIHRLGMVKEFGRKLSAYKTKESLIGYMDDFIEKNGKSITFDKITKQLRGLNSDILIEDPDTGIVMAEILDYKTSKETGSPDWCIVTGESSWNNYTRGTKRQFFLWDFSKERTNSLFMVGFTTNNVGQITDIHDKYDISLSGNIPNEIKTSLKSINLSTDPFEYKNKIMNHVSNGLASKVDYDDNNDDILILRVNKEVFNSFRSDGWAHYSPFPYSGDVNFYFYVIYNFKYPLNDGRFCRGVDLSDDGELIVINTIDNLGERGFIKAKSDDKFNTITNSKNDFVDSLYKNGYIKAKDIEDVLQEKKETYLNKIEEYVKGGEINNSRNYSNESKYINTSTEEGSTGSKWLFEIHNDDLSKFTSSPTHYGYKGDKIETLIGDWTPQNRGNIHKFNLYCIVDLDESYRSPDFIRFIKLGENDLIIKYNTKEDTKIKYNDVSELSEDVQEFIENGHMKVKTSSDYSKEYMKAKNKIFNDAKSEYDDDEKVLLGRVLFNYLIDENDLDVEDFEHDKYEEDPIQYMRTIIPDGGHYNLTSFTIFTTQMILQGYGGDEWAIGVESDAQSSAIEYMKSSLEEGEGYGLEDHINAESLANDYADDESYYEELFREDPSSYDIGKEMKDGVEDNIDNSNKEIDELNEKKDKHEASKEKTEERLEKFEEFIESKLDKIDELQSDEIDDEDPDKKRKINRLEVIKKRLNNRLEVNKKRYEDLIEKYEDSIEKMEERIEVLEEEITEMEDEDNDDYWELDESDIETKASSYAKDSRNNVLYDPIQYLKDMGYTNEYQYGSDHRNRETLNDILSRYVDYDKAAKSIVDSDGRGPSLSSYDHEEREFYYDGETYYIYRTN